MRTIKLFIAFMMTSVLAASAQDQQSLFFSAKLEGTIESVEKQLREELKAEKFGVITEIDMAKTLKEKIDAEIIPYKILGVCHPGFAYEAIQAEENIGVFLPCKIILKQVSDNTVEVVSVNPATMMQMIGNPDLNETASEVGAKLERVVKSMNQQ